MRWSIRRDLDLYIRLQRINVVRDRRREQFDRIKRAQNQMIDPAKLARMRTFAQRHEARMDRILTRIEESDKIGDASEEKCNAVMDDFESYQASVDSQISDIATFTKDLERAMGNVPRSAPSSNGVDPVSARPSETAHLAQVK